MNIPFSKLDVLPRLEALEQSVERSRESGAPPWIFASEVLRTMPADMPDDLAYESLMRLGALSNQFTSVAMVIAQTTSAYITQVANGTLEPTEELRARIIALHPTAIRLHEWQIDLMESLLRWPMDRVPEANRDTFELTLASAELQLPKAQESLNVARIADVEEHLDGAIELLAKIAEATGADSADVLHGLGIVFGEMVADGLLSEE